MWFKNIKAYWLTQPLQFDPETLQSALTECAFRPCGKQDLTTMGFCSPFASAKQSPSNAALFHQADGRIWVTLKKQERLLPAAVVNAELAEKVAAIEAETGSPVGKKQQQDLKQEITHALLPRAFTKNSFTHAFISPSDNLVIVDASADGKAEALLAMLRKAIGSLPVVPIARHNLANELTAWLSDAPPKQITLLEEAELESSDEVASVIRCKNQPLDSDEIQQHLAAGKLVKKVALDYMEMVQGIICDDGSIKRLKFADTLIEANDDIPKEDVLQRLDAEFVLMSAEVCTLVKHLSDVIGLAPE